ncbi:N-6 DNA methylase [Mycoplasmopsis columbinasalis]|uniref:Type IIS restriction enzyme Eco57I n=1 Tax=Mycoplasmopsis columbinasalis TaxID=114880 RepID=A0A449BAA9_9BACT|nr:N-6 DNA methylase [Mycoplasmopsis columbinasalis]VEU78141.1 Type IIS restriction enzyme Eco57I [Mycoplasmopsis columbinasalis]
MNQYLYLNELKEKFVNFIEKEGIFTFFIKNEKVIVDMNSLKWEIENFSNLGHERILNLNNSENWSVLMLICELFQKGYIRNELYLEKSWQLGHDSSGYCDVALYQNGKPYYFFEVKNIVEISKYINLKHEKYTKQLFSYMFQDKSVKVGSYYTYNFSNHSHQFYNIFVNDTLRNSLSVDDMFNNWNKTWNTASYVLENNLFDIKFTPVVYKQLKKIDNDSVKTIFNQFLTILRQNSVSDKSNAFDKMINIFVAKVYDELKEDTSFEVNGQKVTGVKFQFIQGLDDNISFIKRLNDLYKLGMSVYMKKDIIDYSDSEIYELLKNSKSSFFIKQMIDNLRLKKNSAFAFIEVFDDKTFEENAQILKELVLLLQNYRFKYNNKHQFLGDFFEELLNTSWKQEAGQFFTPMPIVDFMIHSLPIANKIRENIENKNDEIVPKMIDYASGSGHFIVAYMDFVQSVLDEINIETSSQVQKKLQSYKISPFSWARDSIVAIEKDYRLAKTTKISTFLNGDGDATIINGDGIDKFDAIEYRSTLLYSEKKENAIFDFVIANPPYSVAGFMKNIKKKNINEQDFSLLKHLDEKSSEIEVLFIERTKQLLKNDGIGAIVLPRSFLTSQQYIYARKFVLENFKILAIFESADNTFSGTTTSPIILFLKKQKLDKNQLNYELLIINSPKMLFESTTKEKQFLGYEFSSNRNKLGITILNNNLVKNYAPLVKKFILTGVVKDLPKYAFVTKLNQILVDDKDHKSQLIYTRYKQHQGDFVALDSLIDEINPIYSEEQKQKLVNENTKYIEISDIENGQIKIKNNKHKKSAKIAQKNDILISSLPNNKKIAISDSTYYVSPAIYVLRVSDEKLRDKIYKYIFNNKNNIIDDMNVFLDGFKITYGKINEHNLKNNIYIDKKLLEKI